MTEPTHAGSTPSPDRARPNALATVAGIAFLLFVVALPTSIAVMTITGAASILLTLLWWRWGGGPGWVRSPVDLPALGWLAALLIAALCAQDRTGSLPRITKGFMPALVAIAASQTLRRANGQRAVALLLGAAGLVCVIGLARWVASGASYDARAGGVVGFYMTFAGQMLLLTTLAAGVALFAGERRWRIGAALVAVLGAVALAITFTRSSWIGLVVALCVLLGAKRPRWLLVLAAAAVAVYLFAPGSFGARLHSMFDPNHPWNRERVLMWGAGWRMFRDHPLTGVGLQDLHPLYERYRSPEAHEAVGHLHDVFVQIGASMGVIGLAAFAWLYSGLVRSTTQGLRAQLKRGGVAAGVRVGVLAGLAGFIAAGLFEWNFGDEELLWQLYTLVGIAWAARNWDA